MNDALTKDTHEPKDPAGNHFQDFHRRADAWDRRLTDLEHRWEIYEVHAKALGAQLVRIEALEGRIEADGTAINRLFTRMIGAEEALTAQLDRIKALEGRVTHLEANRSWHRARVTGLEAALRQQRAVNEALFYRLNDAPHQEDDKLIAALHEALK